MTATTITAGDASAGLIQTAGNDGTLVLQAGPAGAKVNALSLDASGNATVFTQAITDASTKIATTQWVINNSLRFVAGSGTISGAVTLTLPDLGKSYYVYNGSFTITLPITTAADVGKTFTFYIHGNGPYTIAAGAGGTIYSGGNPSGAASMSMGLGDTVTLSCFGANLWMTTSEAHCIGIGQTVSANLSGSRAIGTTYTNSTGKPIFVIGAGLNTTAGILQVNINGTAVQAYQAASGAPYMPFSFLVPAGFTYAVATAGGTWAINNWHEIK